MVWAIAWSRGFSDCLKEGFAYARLRVPLTLFKQAFLHGVWISCIIIIIVGQSEFAAERERERETA